MKAHGSFKGAVIYCRVSTSEQAQTNWSLETQEAECRRYCQQNALQVKQVFVEAGRSAKTTAGRPAFQQMIEYCRRNKGTLDAVVVLAVSRFSRDTATGGQAILELDQLDVEVLSVTEKVDQTPMGRFARSLFLALAQLDNDQKKDKAKRDMVAALERGRWTHSPPLGYRATRLGLRPDPDRAPLVAEAFERFATGSYTKAQVLDRVNRNGLKTLRGMPVSAQTFGNMLRNPLYAGWLAPKKWGGRYRGDHPALITQEVFDAVQALLDGRRIPQSPYLRNNPLFPLRRFIVCARCGVPLTGSSVTNHQSKRYSYDSCRTTGCAGNVAKEQLESQFESLVQSLRPRPDYMRLMRAVFDEVWSDQQQQAIQQARAVERRQAKLREQRGQLVAAFVYSKSIDSETYEIEKNRLEEEERLLATEPETQQDSLNVDALWSIAERLLGRADEIWRQADADDKQRLQKVLFPAGLTYDSGKFGTAGSCPFYESWSRLAASESELASPTGLGKQDRVGGRLRRAA